LYEKYIKIVVIKTLSSTLTEGDNSFIELFSSEYFFFFGKLKSASQILFKTGLTFLSNESSKIIDKINIAKAMMKIMIRIVTAISHGPM